MDASRALAAEQAVALAAGISRDLKAQGPSKGLPRPRFLVAVFAFYGILGIVASFGRTGSRFAVAAGGVAALTTVVVGPGGAALIDLFQKLGGLTQPGSGSSSSAGGVAAADAAAGTNTNLHPAGPNVSVPITGNIRSRGVPIDPITGKPALVG